MIEYVTKWQMFHCNYVPNFKYMVFIDEKKLQCCYLLSSTICSYDRLKFWLSFSSFPFFKVFRFLSKMLMSDSSWRFKGYASNFSGFLLIDP